MPELNHTQDDDGVIDLRALCSVPPPPSTTSVAPLFSEPPPSAFSLDAQRGPRSLMPRRGSKASSVAILGGAMALVVIAGAGIAFAFRGATPVDMARLAPPPPQVAAAAALPPLAPTVLDPAPATDETEAESAPSRVTSHDKAKAGAKGHVKARAKAPETAAKPADRCGCRGNLDCNIRCSAGK